MLRDYLRGAASVFDMGAAGYRPSEALPFDGAWADVTAALASSVQRHVDMAETRMHPTTLHRALAAALVAATHPPGPELLESLARNEDRDMVWDELARRLLFRLLEEGNVRSFRLLEATGVLDLALPELAAAVQRRREGLDPDASWRLVERVRALREAAAVEYLQLTNPEWLLLAALMTAGDWRGIPDGPERLARRLGLTPLGVEHVTTLVRHATAGFAGPLPPSKETQRAVLLLHRAAAGAGPVVAILVPASHTQVLSGDDLLHEIVRLVAGLFDLSPAQVTEEARFDEDLGMDGLDQVELIMEIEDRFGISIPEDRIEGIRTVRDAAALVIELLIGDRESHPS